MSASDKPRWSTAQKSAAKKSRSDSGASRSTTSPRIKKARWVDGAPPRPESADKGKRRAPGSAGAQSNSPRRDDRRPVRDDRPANRWER
ncbi:MAG: hypothetical protein WBB91_05580, partial [Nostocoides sp.]|uniref:hypothetical protein n=1 Tax=Nostocoides sp. TaxID=1917966 RepID=UPI003C7217BD